MEKVIYQLPEPIRETEKARGWRVEIDFVDCGFARSPKTVWVWVPKSWGEITLDSWEKKMADSLRYVGCRPLKINRWRFLNQ